jgi:hypothetical protein
VVSSFPLGEIICNPDAAGRIAKWSVELMGETLAYAPRKAIKSQILADFVLNGQTRSYRRRRSKQSAGLCISTAR